jgi:hypothetical protein
MGFPRHPAPGVSEGSRSVDAASRSAGDMRTAAARATPMRRSRRGAGDSGRVLKRVTGFEYREMRVARVGFSGDARDASRSLEDIEHFTPQLVPVFPKLSPRRACRGETRDNYGISISDVAFSADRWYFSTPPFSKRDESVLLRSRSRARSRWVFQNLPFENVRRSTPIPHLPARLHGAVRDPRPECKVGTSSYKNMRPRPPLLPSYTGRFSRKRNFLSRAGFRSHASNAWRTESCSSRVRTPGGPLRRLTNVGFIKLVSTISRGKNF